MRTYRLFLLLALLLVLSFACTKTFHDQVKDRVDAISIQEMQSVTEFIGSDYFEGRAPGTRGGELGEHYLKSLFKFMNLQAGNMDSYMQPFMMKGFENDGVELSFDGQEVHFPDEVVGAFTTEENQVSITGDAVFVGFGVETDIWDWNDYKDVDLTNKVIITRVNDPGMLVPGIFEGDTLTYFGRWTCHVEEAAKRGASAVLLIHTDESAGYDWNVVRNSWSGEELYIASDLENNLKFRGWIKEAALEKILRSKGIELKDLYATTTSRDFHPVDLGIKVKLSGSNHFRETEINNVIASIPGKVEKRIVLSAHTDHLGMASGMDGDSIFNGAIDNGTALAAMLLTAKILNEFRDELYYSVTILACNAEESGLLGSRYYVQNTDRNSIVANINFESTPVWGEAGSIMGIGARFSGFEEILKELATEDDLSYSSFSLANQGLFFRSDQYSFARYGIPAVWISAGEDEKSGERNYTEFWGKDYHTVRDEFNPDWELEGMRQTIRYVLYTIDYLNKQQEAPEWKANIPFPVQ